MMVSLIPAERLELLAALARSTHLIPGAAAEVGVFHGGSAEVLAAAMPERVLHLFDTFTGLPEPRPLDGPHCSKGRFVGSVAEVRKRVPSAIIHPGKLHWATDVPPGPYAFVHIDVDLFESTMDALLQFYPLVLPGGIIVVDDYAGQPTPGATKAVDAFMEDVRETLVMAECGGCWFRKE
jgi:predicted O-methyltransferase YrrM